MIEVVRQLEARNNFLNSKFQVFWTPRHLTPSHPRLFRSSLEFSSYFICMWGWQNKLIMPLNTQNKSSQIIDHPFRNYLRGQPYWEVFFYPTQWNVTCLFIIVNGRHTNSKLANRHPLDSMFSWRWRIFPKKSRTTSHEQVFCQLLLIQMCVFCSSTFSLIARLLSSPSSSPRLESPHGVQHNLTASTQTHPLRRTDRRRASRDSTIARHKTRGSRRPLRHAWYDPGR